VSSGQKSSSGKTLIPCYLKLWGNFPNFFGPKRKKRQPRIETIQAGVDVMNYDHNFLRFSTTFGGKNWHFSQKPML
jgi:hypothetical protein